MCVCTLLLLFIFFIRIFISSIFSDFLCKNWNDCTLQWGKICYVYNLHSLFDVCMEKNSELCSYQMCWNDIWGIKELLQQYYTIHLKWENIVAVMCRCYSYGELLNYDFQFYWWFSSFVHKWNETKRNSSNRFPHVILLRTCENVSAHDMCVLCRREYYR